MTKYEGTGAKINIKLPQPMKNYVCLDEQAQRFIGRFTNFNEVLGSQGVVVKELTDFDVHAVRWFKLDGVSWTPCEAPLSFINVVDW